MGIVKRWFMVMRSRHPEFLEVVEGGTACQLANLYGGQWSRIFSVQIRFLEQVFTQSV